MMNYIVPTFFIVGGLLSLLFYYSNSFYNKMANTHGKDFANTIFWKLKIGGYVQLSLACLWIIMYLYSRLIP